MWRGLHVARQRLDAAFCFHDLFEFGRCLLGVMTAAIAFQHNGQLEERDLSDEACFSDRPRVFHPTLPPLSYREALTSTWQPPLFLGSRSDHSLGH